MIDKITPNGKWCFNAEVASVFDDMLNRSIPEYHMMRQLVYKLGTHFISNKATAKVVDIGCSTGLAVEPFVQNFSNAEYHLIDVSRPMLDVCSSHYHAHENVKVYEHDIIRGMPTGNVDLILSVLSVQFTPIEYRQNILRSIYESLNKGGALIFVEKVLGNGVDIDDLLVEEYLRMKADNQYTHEQISAKRKSLIGVLVPLTERWNLDLLKNAGFNKVDCFFRILNFAGWIGIK